MNRAPLYGLRVVATSVMLLSMGAVLVLAMFRSTLGPFSFAEPRTGPEEWRVVLWSPGSEAERRRGTRRWRERLEDRFSIEVWDQLDPAGLLAARGALVIVDGARLDGEAARALRTFVDKGGRLALFGVRALDGKSTDALSFVLDRPVVPAEAIRWTLLPQTDGPLAAGFSATRRLPLRRVMAEYTVPDAIAEVSWKRAEAGGPAPAAALRDARGAGRLVWWSVRPDGALDRVDAQAAMTRVVRASLAWLLEEPFAEIEPGREEDRESLERVEARVHHTAGNRFLLSLTNRNDGATPPLRLRLHLNRPATGVEMQQTTVRFGSDELSPLAGVRLLPGDGGTPIVAVTVPALAARESRSFFADLR